MWGLAAVVAVGGAVVVLVAPVLVRVAAQLLAPAPDVEIDGLIREKGARHVAGMEHVDRARLNAVGGRRWAEVAQAQRKVLGGGDREKERGDGDGGKRDDDGHDQEPQAGGQLRVH